MIRFINQSHLVLEIKVITMGRMKLTIRAQNCLLWLVRDIFAAIAELDFAHLSFKIARDVILQCLTGSTFTKSLN